MDVIKQLEPELFRKVTGLTLKDFDLLVSLGVFNRDLMNDAVYKFKRYEDSSLEYTGINTHSGTVIGGWDTVIDTAEIIEQKTEEPETISTKEEPVVDETEPWEELQIGDKVYHKSFGQGELVSRDEKYIIVKFPSRESKFLYPSVFENGYLSCTEWESDLI